MRDSAVSGTDEIIRAKGWMRSTGLNMSIMRNLRNLYSQMYMRRQLY